jgi:hypothetical protein
MNHISTVILWTNGTVSVFEENGDQVLRLEGRLGDVLPAVLADAGATTRYFFGELTKGLWETDRAAFLRMVRP